MKTSQSILLSVAVAALCGASGLHAQTQATASIPFAFSAQNTTLPAGQYVMYKAGLTHNLMVVRNVETRQALLVLTPDAAYEYKGPQDKNVILFHRIGDRYFLAEVKTAAVDGHVPPSRQERELDSEGAGQPMAAVIIPALGVR